MRGIQGSFRSETTDWEEGAWEDLGGLTRESVEQDASVPKKGKSFERDATLPVSSKDGTVLQRTRWNFFTELQLLQRTWYTRLG